MGSFEPARPPHATQVGEYLGEVVNTLLENNDPLVMHGRWFDTNVDILHFTSPASESRRVGKVGYHVVYRAVNLIERTRTFGLVVANPHLIAPYTGAVYSREKTSRHYLATEGFTGVKRRDKYERSSIAEFALRGTIRSLAIAGPDWLPNNRTMRVFKNDVLTVVTANPLMPESNKTPELIDIQDDLTK